MSPGLLRVLGEGHYRVVFPETGIEFTVDRLRRERHELVGELSVACGIAGARVVDGVLSVGTLNLSNPGAAHQRARLLADRARTSGIPWGDMLEEVRQRVLAEERKGAPSIDLRTVSAQSSTEAEYEICGLSLPADHATILFGDGGTGKSLLALRILSELAASGRRVGLFDWELSDTTHRRRLEAINGPEMPDIRYARFDRPLVHELDRAQRIVREDRLDFVVLDSIGYGTAGAPESAEAALDYFRAWRQLRVGGLLLAHVTKAENGDQRPFGSTFWHNSARSTWNLKLASTSPDGQTLHLAAFHRKSNLGRLRPPVGLRLEFQEDRVHVVNVDAASIDEVAASLPMHVRLRGVLKTGARTIGELAEELDAKQETVKKALGRGGETFTKLTKTPDGVHRWALLERRTA